jgi:hypothetical protein
MAESDLLAEPVGLFPHLQKAVASEDVDALSSHLSTGAFILEELSQRLSANAKCIDVARIASIRSLKERANTPRTILGVVGSTGHGKSSLINAILEEDKLVSLKPLATPSEVFRENNFPVSPYLLLFLFLSLKIPYILTINSNY